MRSISEDLRPGLLDHLGLSAALAGAVRRFAERTEIDCRMIDAAGDVGLSQARATAVYRICQEALTNIARHAAATRVTVRLGAEAGCLMLEIEDNGCGLVSLTPTGKSIGLLSMAERAREFGGSLSARSGEAGGTCLILSLPLEEVGKMIEILMADDHAISVVACAACFSDEPDMRIVAEAANGLEGLQHLRSRAFGVVLLDVNMGGRSGFETLRRIHAEWPSQPVIMLSMYPEEQYAQLALEVGARLCPRIAMPCTLWRPSGRRRAADATCRPALPWLAGRQASRSSRRIFA